MDAVIRTIKQNCRRCYSCVRDCPAKAIRIVDGQASVVPERCIACGNCTAVCSQGAKAYESGLERTLELLAAPPRQPVAALIAPSFPAAFPGVEPGRLAGALRAAGFDLVVEVAHGADLVGDAYRAYLEAHTTGLRIATACPAVVEFVRKYRPELTGCLIPLVSPMIATALAVRRVHGEAVRCVFVGPCVAKKAEARDPSLPAVIDEVLTFAEAHLLLERRGLDATSAAPAPFDPPAGGLGRVFPLVGGLLRCAGLKRNLLQPELLVLSGQHETIDVLRHLDVNDPTPLLVEAMMCRGCYQGPGLRADGCRLERKRRISEYVTECLRQEGLTSLPPPTAGALTRTSTSTRELPLGRGFVADDQRLAEPTEEQIRVILARTNKFSPEDELNCGACGYHTCRDKAVAVHRGLAEETMCLPFMIEQAERVCAELKVPARELHDVHRHIINTEKLASLGQMAAGVAHELNNPLGTILLYADILGRKLRDRGDLKHDLDLLASESQRCKKIIGNLLDFARQNRVKLEPVDVGELLRHAVDESRWASRAAGCGVRLELDAPAGLVADLDRDQISQVLVNLVNNGLEAMEGRTGTIAVSGRDVPEKGRVHLEVRDEGAGIPEEARDKVFQPFFTTKSIGRGTGLGLPISYGIVKMHRGTIWFDTEPGRGTTFHVELPRSQAERTRSMVS